MKTLYLDTETFSETPIQHGTYRYAENCEVMVVQFAMDGEPVQVFDLTEGEQRQQEARAALESTIQEADQIVIHNAMFDRAVLALSKNFRVDLPLQKLRCSAVAALEHGMPMGLEKLCHILGVPEAEAKLEGGKRLINLFCKPRAKNIKIRRATKTSHPSDWSIFLEYARMDIIAARAVWNRMPRWNYGGSDEIAKHEVALWHLDQEMNDLGIPVDLDLVGHILEAVTEEKRRLNAQLVDETEGLVSTLMQRDKLLDFMLARYGVTPADLQGVTVERFLQNDDLPPEVISLLEIRLKANRSSASKYQAFQRATSKDGRLRGMFQFAGASRTRRDAGRTVQLQNLPSRGLLSEQMVEYAVAAFRCGHSAIDMTVDDVMHAAASCIRGCLVPPDGHRFVVSDLSNIEGRMLAWMAGEQWKIDAFSEFDAGRGHDLYCLAYAKSFGIDPGKVDKKQRGIGKVQELALGYQGGISAFVTFADGYGINLEHLAETAWDFLDPELVRESTDFVQWQREKGQRFPISDKAAITCDVFKRAWRNAHPMTVALWKQMEENLRKSVGFPGETLRYRGFAFRTDGKWSRILLPSGRYLVYPGAQVDKRGQLSYMGVHQFTKQWTRIKTYAGKLTENATQTLARDCMFDNLIAIREAGYLPVGRVHDEVITIAPDSEEFTSERLSALLAANTSWNLGLPLAAKGEAMYRYRK